MEPRILLVLKKIVLLTLILSVFNSCSDNDVPEPDHDDEPPPPAFNCGDNVSFTYRGVNVTYGTISRGGLCWMDRNLGASRVPTSSTDNQGYGDLFQWGRLDDGHQRRTSGTTTTLSNSNVPGHSNFIIKLGDPWDWRSPQNDNLWQGEGGTNNPCPDGWRLPKINELNGELQSWDPKNSEGAYSSTLKWPVAGFRFSNGQLWSPGEYGAVWSSSVSSYQAQCLRFATEAGLNTHYRGHGLSVRCVKDD